MPHSSVGRRHKRKLPALRTPFVKVEHLILIARNRANDKYKRIKPYQTVFQEMSHRPAWLCLVPRWRKAPPPPMFTDAPSPKKVTQKLGGKRKI
eukprot:686371-Alexandrium_andersonii.AAC.1